MSEREFFRLFLIIWGFAGFIVFFLLLRIPAPYGRYVNKKRGFNTKAGWFLMEFPALLFFIFIFFAGKKRFEPVPLFFLFLWLYHYIYRTFFYTFRLSPHSKPVPYEIVSAGIIFNIVNAYIQARYLSHFSNYSSSWFYDIRFISGTVIFFTGSFILRNSDGILLKLKKMKHDYSVPSGGFFRYVSCPNYFGELIQWTGFAIGSWSFSGALFAFWTFANLAPRALNHHRWYKENFTCYPPERKALIPYVL